MRPRYVEYINVFLKGMYYYAFYNYYRDSVISLMAVRDRRLRDSTNCQRVSE